MGEGALHPRRVASALDWLVDHHGPAGIPIQTLDSCIAALRMVQKTQVAAGITAERADAVGQAITLFDYVKTHLTRK